jgi:hypothetical protein
MEASDLQLLEPLRGHDPRTRGMTARDYARLVSVYLIARKRAFKLSLSSCLLFYFVVDSCFLCLDSIQRLSRR